MSIETIIYPRASFSGLPVELKTEIVKLARRQDVAFATRADGTNYEPFPDPDIAPQFTLESKHLEAFGTRHGKCINALFQTNKEFSELAAVHLFHTLTAQCAAAPIFLFDILPRRAALFRAVHFDTTADRDIEGGSDFTRVISLLHTFPNLHEFILDGPFSPFLSRRLPLAVYSKRGAPKDYAHAAFCRAAAVIDTLTLLAIEPRLVSEILGLFPSVRHLVLDGVTGRGPDGSIDLAAAALLKLESLDLDETSAHPYRVQIPKSWSGYEWKSATTLKRLAIHLAEFDADAMDFIRVFSSSLETLELTVTCRSIDSNLLGTIGGKPFPRLTSLTISTRAYNDAVQMLGILGPSPLLHLRLELADSEYLMVPALAEVSLFPLLNGMPSLRQLCLGDGELSGIPWLSHAGALSIRQYCDEHNITLVRDNHDDVLHTFDEDSCMDYTEEAAMANVCAELRDVLDYGTARLEAVERMGDVAGANELVTVLEKLHTRMGIERH